MRSTILAILAILLADPGLAEEPSSNELMASPEAVESLEARTRALQLRLNRELAARVERRAQEMFDSDASTDFGARAAPAKAAPEGELGAESDSTMSCAFVHGGVLHCRVLANRVAR